jgi:hypothetical protein
MKAGDETFVAGSTGLTNPLVHALPTPALRKEREGRGTLCVADACKIKSLGQPAFG